MKSLLIRYYLKIPDNIFKKKIRCFYYNNFKKIDGKFHYSKGRYVMEAYGYSCLFYDNPINFFFPPIPGYLKHGFPSKEDIVVDAGASIGTFAILAAKIVGPNGKVVAFEPNKEFASKLRRNLELNDVDNVLIVEKGLWNEDTELEFQEEGQGSALRAPGSTKVNGTVPIPVVSLFGELERLGVNRADFIKMDIEGAEIEVVESMLDRLRKEDVHLVIASYHIVGGSKTCFRLEEMFKGIGYEVTTEYEDHLTTYAHRASE